ncbi:hypothetical protein [Candidatus Magnetobacterium casense]|uniref:Uncharacterized protein n=1 Tax=Candidatus Magnetobacterium casense TaxID=1455061 RepID=A0ABS6RXL9_9BACT|nr:hypothetical protein [Candidatus Magnetobacterium casensis]MBV6341361.1 hypothetical protein [Candidatus Magnetobacterium casensis]
MKAKGLYPYLDWLAEYRSQITTIVFFIWLSVVVYWFYCFQFTVADPIKATGVFVENFQDSDDGSINARAALVFVFWAATSGIFVVGFVIYAVKFIYNILMGVIYGAVPTKVHKLVTPIVFLIAMWPCFRYQEQIKTAYVVLYREGSDIVRLAGGFDLKIDMNRYKSETKDESEPSNGEHKGLFSNEAMRQ